MVLLPPCKMFSERFLQIGVFSSSLRRGLSYRGSAWMQEMWVFSCTSAGRIRDTEGAPDSTRDVTDAAGYVLKYNRYAPNISPVKRDRSRKRQEECLP